MNPEIYLKLLTDCLLYSYQSKNLHQIEQLKKSFKINAEFLNVYTNQFEEKKASEKIKKDIKHIVIFPGGNWIPKIWPIENYNILLKKLCEKYLNIKFIIVGSNIEKKIYLEKIKNGISDNKFISYSSDSISILLSLLGFVDNT